jgi:cell division protein FtsB
LTEYEGGQTAVQRHGLVAELETEKSRIAELEEKVHELRSENSKYREIVEDYTRQTRRDSATQLTLHQQQVSLTAFAF